MTDLYLLEPTSRSAWFPFSDSRPICELRAGAWLIRERWEATTHAKSRTIFGPKYLASFVEDNAPSVDVLHPVAGPAIVGRSDFAPSGVSPELSSDRVRLVNEGETVGWWVPEGTWDGSPVEWPEVELEGVRLLGAYDLVTALEHLLPADVADFVGERGDALPDGSTVIGDPGNIILLGASIEPGVTFDVREGPVVIEQHTYVKGGTRLEGPMYIGPGTVILGGQISRSTIGPRCRVRGEVSASVFLSYSNKAHDGFIGHSVVGRWVNLGAGTTTSNLKNTYGEVRLNVDGNQIETGRQFLGTLFGDHVKSAIGTMFPTGAVVGTGANVVGERAPPKYIHPFAWGTTDDLVSLDGFLKTAERVMLRRDMTLTEEQRAMLTAIHRHSTC